MALHVSRTGRHTCPEGQSVDRRHCTQAPAAHTGVAAGQSVLVTQSTQVPPVPQTFPCSFAQSALPAHWTQTDSLVLHTGVAPEHSELVVQPGMHVKVRGLQMGRAAPHWELSRQATQRPAPTKQNGALGVRAEQSESAAQATHWPVSWSQIVSAPVQSPASRQPTQKPPPASQCGVAPRHTAASVAAVQAA
jgi:hypothetical protein